jgi:hypothetical protein
LYFGKEGVFHREQIFNLLLLDLVVRVLSYLTSTKAIVVYLGLATILLGAYFGYVPVESAQVFDDANIFSDNSLDLGENTTYRDSLSATVKEYRVTDSVTVTSEFGRRSDIGPSENKKYVLVRLSVENSLNTKVPFPSMSYTQPHMRMSVNQGEAVHLERVAVSEKVQIGPNTYDVYRSPGSPRGPISTSGWVGFRVLEGANVSNATVTVQFGKRPLQEDDKEVTWNLDYREEWIINESGEQKRRVGI